MREDKKRALEFREQIFDLYGFTESAREFIRAKSSIIVRNFSSNSGGGFWHPPPRKQVELFTSQHEGAVHELSHVWWHFFREKHPEIKSGLVLDTVRLADLNSIEYTGCEQAINHAHGYVYGINDWIGMYGNADYKNNLKNKPKDIHNLTDKYIEILVNDWEIFAGFCSFMMGRFRYGPRQLPTFMWKYFDPMFTGIVDTAPYYMGGRP